MLKKYKFNVTIWDDILNDFVVVKLQKAASNEIEAIKLLKKVIKEITKKGQDARVTTKSFELTEVWKLLIKQGKSYKTRDGRIAYVDKTNKTIENEFTTIWGHIKNKKNKLVTCTWDMFGKNGSVEPNKDDLISEV